MKKILSLAVVMAMPGLCFAENTQAYESFKTELEDLQKKIEKLEAESKVNSDSIQQQKLSKTNDLSVKPYGFIRFDMAYHDQGSDKIFNKINTVPLDTEKGANGRLLYNVNASRLGVDIQKKINDQDVLAKVEIDFRGGADNDQLRVRHAYVKVDNWLFGQTTSPFVSADILPEMVDFMANVGGGIQRNPMIQYQHNFDANLKSWFALEDGSRGTDDQTRFPAFTTKTQYKLADNKGLVNLRTLLIQKKTTEDDALAWGVGLGGIYQLDANNKIHADYYHVKGDSKFMLFANDGYVLDEEKNIVENEYDSLALGLTHLWNPKWRSSLGFGAMLADDQTEYARLNKKANESLYQGWVNLFYAPNKSLNYAVEYVYGERTNFNDAKGTDSRIEAMVKYSF